MINYLIISQIKVIGRKFKDSGLVKSLLFLFRWLDQLWNHSYRITLAWPPHFLANVCLFTLFILCYIVITGYNWISHTCSFLLSHFWNAIFCCFDSHICLLFSAKEGVWICHTGSWWPHCILLSFLSSTFNPSHCSDTKTSTLWVFLRCMFWCDLCWEKCWLKFTAHLYSYGLFHVGRTGARAATLHGHIMWMLGGSAELCWPSWIQGPFCNLLHFRQIVIFPLVH